MLSLAGLETPPTMDGKSMLPLLVQSASVVARPAPSSPASLSALSASSAASGIRGDAAVAVAAAAAAGNGDGDGVKVPGSVARYLRSHSSSAATAQWRTAHFIEYYYVGIGPGQLRWKW